MVIGEHLHELLELILAFLLRGCQQFLNDLEHRHDVPFLRFAELCHEQDRRCEQTFGGIVEVGVLSEGCCIHTGQDDGLRYDLGVLFCLRLVYQGVGMLLVQIHILVHEVQEIIAVTASRVSQVNDRYVISVLLGDVSVVTHDVAFGIGGEPRHSRCAGILDTRVQPKGSFTDTCCTDHKSVDVAGVHHRRCVSGASHHDALRQRLAVIARGSLSFGCLLTPTLRIKRHVLIDFLYLGFGRPSSRAVLTVAYGL